MKIDANDDDRSLESILDEMEDESIGSDESKESEKDI